MREKYDALVMRQTEEHTELVWAAKAPALLVTRDSGVLI